MDRFGGAAFADIIAEIDRLRGLPERQHALAALLAEQSPIYAGRPTGEAERLRGYLLASFDQTGLPEEALPFVIEALETGLNPYVVAAAAKALRVAGRLPDGIPALLLSAIDRIRSSDDIVNFDLRAGPATVPPVTALMELFCTLAWLGPRARESAPQLRQWLDLQPSCFSASVRAAVETALTAVSVGGGQPVAHCCAMQPAPISFAPKVQGDIDIATTELQDQDGAVFSFGDFFPGRPSVLTFFYSRCMNPNKCSLTITRLARLQQRINAEGRHGHFNVAALTYDPEFDLPGRLRGYGADRGMSFDERNRLLRTTGSFEPFRRWLDLGVGYGTTTVNQHRIDMVILDGSGRPCASIVRQQWDEADVLAALKALPFQSCAGGAPTTISHHHQ
jgi:cytochrome oxidase Cu insertion factor (SCO1/SenC/PrrC family)